MSDGVEIKSRHQRAGILWKLPMSKCVNVLASARAVVTRYDDPQR